MDYNKTLEHPVLETALKKLIIDEADKGDEFSPEHLSDDEPLFGRKSAIALDSMDALQIAVALQAHFNVRLQGDRMVRKHMMTVANLADFIRAQAG